MRVLLITHQYLPDFIGGVELYTQSLANQLVELGHEVAIFTRRNEAGDGMSPLLGTDQPYPHVYAVHHGNMSDAKRFIKTYGDSHMASHFVQLLDHFQPEVVHIQHLMGMPYQMVNELRRREIPYVFSLHDYWSFCSNANLLTNYSNERCQGPKAHLNCTRCFIARGRSEPSLSYARPLFTAASPAIWGLLGYRRHLTDRFIAGAAAIVVSSNFVRNWYSQQGIAAERIEVLPIGIEEADDQSHKPYLAPVDGPQAGAIRFLYLGGISRTKGVHTVVEAFASLPEQLKSKAELWIIGDETVLPDYSAELKSFPQESITFLGPKPRAVAMQKMAECHVVLVPSLWDETFNLVAHQGLLADRPIFVSDVGALTELVQDGQNGRLLPPNDAAAWQAAMEQLVRKPSLLRAMQPTQSSWQPRIVGLGEHTQELLRIYQALLA